MTMTDVKNALRERDNPHYSVSPDYANDLNAQQRVLERLTDNEWSRLAWAIKDRGPVDLWSVRTVLKLSATERAECIAIAIAK